MRSHDDCSSWIDAILMRAVSAFWGDLVGEDRQKACKRVGQASGVQSVRGVRGQAAPGTCLHPGSEETRRHRLHQASPAMVARSECGLAVLMIVGSRTEGRESTAPALSTTKTPRKPRLSGTGAMRIQVMEPGWLALRSIHNLFPCSLNYPPVPLGLLPSCSFKTPNDPIANRP